MFLHILLLTNTPSQPRSPPCHREALGRTVLWVILPPPAPLLLSLPLRVRPRVGEQSRSNKAVVNKEQEQTDRTELERDLEGLHGLLQTAAILVYQAEH